MKTKPSDISKINSALLAHGFSQSKTGLFTSLFCATVILFGLQNTHIKTILFDWYLFFVIVTLFRLAVTQIYQRQERPEKNYIAWRNLYILGAFLGGISWGITGFLFITPETSSASSMLVILVLAGITAGAAPLLAAILSASIIFLATTLIPLILNLFFVDTPGFILFDFTVVAFFIYLIILSIRTHKLIKHSLSLQFENSSLLTSLSQAVNKLEFSSTHDPLTQAANRNLFEVSFTNAIKKAEVNDTKVALLYLDLDNFKDVNDEYGHNIGDQVLLTIINRLSQTLRRTDLISRLGGDEFTMILENVIDIEDIRIIAQKLCQTISDPIKINELEIHVTACIGISIYPLHGKDPKILIREADKAMYHVKDHGQNNFHFTTENTPSTGTEKHPS